MSSLFIAFVEPRLLFTTTLKIKNTSTKGLNLVETFENQNLQNMLLMHIEDFILEFGKTFWSLKVSTTRLKSLTVLTKAV